MKKQHVIVLVFGMLFMLATTGFSQSISFTYDDAGNRQTRALVIKKINSNDISEADEGQKSATLIETITIDDVEVCISPNPNGGKFEVNISNINEQTNVAIYLHSMAGKQIFSSTEVQPNTTVNITNSENGTYILTVVVNGTGETWKVIKQ